MRRFITLIDALYESKSLVLLLADNDPMTLLQIDEETRKTAAYDEIFAFDRTVSRLLEMQSTSYVRQSLETFPQGQDFLATVLGELKLKKSKEEGGQSCPYQNPHPSLLTAPAAIHQHHLNHFTNDESSMIWVMKKIWNHYRIGTIEELQKTVSVHPSTEATAFSDSSSISENLQFMKKETVFIMLVDIADYYVRDVHLSDAKQASIKEYIDKFQTSFKEPFVSFSQYTSIVLNLIRCIHI